MVGQKWLKPQWELKLVQYQHYSTTGGAKNPLPNLKNLTLVVTVGCYICHKT